MKRRDFLVLGTGAGLATAGGLWRFANAPAPTPPGGLPSGLPPFYTPPQDFYITSIDRPPSAWALAHSVSVDGMVEQPGSFSMLRLYAMADLEKMVTLECIGNKLGGKTVGNAVWEGVRLSTLLRAVNVTGKPTTVVFHCLDGYTETMPFDDALSGETLLAFRMNGRLLPPEHGYPIRVIYPGRYGMKNPKWVSRVELTDQPVQGYWAKIGWSETAAIPIKSWIVEPSGGKLPAGEPVRLVGLALAGSEAVGGVTVSTDGGTTYQPARLLTTPAPFVWTFWDFQWLPQKPGDYRLTSLATDARGQVQETQPSTTNQGGSRGLFWLDFQVL